MKKIIISGFDPFDKMKINPSMEVVKELHTIAVDGAEIYPLILPTVYGVSSEIVIEKIKEIKPDSIINLGLAGGRKKIFLERFALNIDDAKTKDNKKIQRRGLLIAEDGPHAYASTLPVTDILKQLHRYKIKAGISNFCGTFVCNHVMYSTLHYIAKNNLPVTCGFIHLPKLSKGKNEVTVEKLLKAIKIIISFLVIDNE
ncbi:MAG: pyroglutamyl-peptidase I [Candidatus Eremiobacterota bacterium]